jgi:hypothetical protein
MGRPADHPAHREELRMTAHAVDAHVHAEDHASHTHGDGYRHETVQHGDHVDHAHGEQRHAAHAEHDDEH